MKTKPSLILLHGALGSKYQLSGLTELLQDEFDTYSFNFEGHGGREISGEYSISRFSQNLLDFMQEHDIQKPLIFGYSMGGYVALRTEIDRPGTIGAIMTLGTKFDWNPQSSEQEAGRLNPSKIQEKVPRFADALHKLHQPLDWKAVVEGTAKMMLSLGSGAASSASAFAAVNCPVLITVGGQDQMVSQTESQLIANQLSNSEFYLFESFKHPIEQVELTELVAKIKSFLKS